MKRPVVVAANWKMHKSAADANAYLAAFEAQAPPPRAGIEVAFFPPFPILEAVGRALRDRADASVGGQNCHWEAEGAFTGEVSAPMLAAAGARRVLVGHSERRQLFGETDETCALKLRAALAAGLDPMLCVGETLEERDRGRARTVVLRQLTRVVEDLTRAEHARLTIAYEPVWAIGTGRTAEPDDAQEMHAAIREILASVSSPDTARATPVLYGGSVKPGNAARLLAEPDIDGALVGGASLDPADFAAILRAAGS
ncbi:MAG TPA: triose-phosphate isomerase [Gemmatimonadota bacterium]|nr:triose-phosphate isomerase [Gemmatimonadota bacterium]